MKLHQVVKLVELWVGWMSWLLQEKVTSVYGARQYDVIHAVVWCKLKLFFGGKVRVTTELVCEFKNMNVPGMIAAKFVYLD